MRPVLRARRRPETDLLHEQRQVERKRYTEMPNLTAHLQPSAAESHGHGASFVRERRRCGPRARRQQERHPKGLHGRRLRVRLHQHELRGCEPKNRSQAQQQESEISVCLSEYHLYWIQCLGGYTQVY